MKIFEEGDNIRIQLAEVDNSTGQVVRMLFDFTVEKKRYDGLKNHMIEHLNKFEVGS